MTVHRSVSEVVEAFRRAAVAGDAEGATALFEDNAILYPPVGGAVVKGKRAIGAVFAGYYGGMEVVEETYDGVTQIVAGDQAATHWQYRLRLRRRGSSEPLQTVTGRATWVLRRGADGGWRIAVDHASMTPTG